MRPTLTAALILTLATAPLHAASPDAWEDFRAAVAKACTALAGGDGTVTVEVNPFGSQSYGAAIVTVTASWGQDRMICIFDKATQAAELTSSFAD